MHNYLPLLPATRWQDLADILIVAYVVYRIALLIRGTRAKMTRYTASRYETWSAISLSRSSRVIQLAPTVPGPVRGPAVGGAW